MTRVMNGLHWRLLMVLCGLWLGLPGSAQAQAQSQIARQVDELNAEAMEAYQNLDIDTAGQKLERAVALAEESGYRGPELARAYDVTAPT